MIKHIAGSRVFASLCLWMIPVVIIGASLPFISQIGTSFDTRVFLGEHNPQYQDLKRFEATFRRTSQVFILLYHRSDYVTEPEFGSIIQSITRDAWSLPNATRVDSLANAPHIVDRDGVISIESALDSPSSAEGALTTDPLVSNLNLNRYVSVDQRVASVVVTCDVPVGTESDVTKIMDAVRHLVGDYEDAYPDLSILVTGEVPLMETFGRAARADSALLVPLGLIVVFTMVAFFLKNWQLVAALVLNAVMAVCFSLLVFSLGGELLNSATSLIPLVLLVVLTASSLHLLLAVKAGLKAQLGPHDAVVSACNQTRAPIVVASLTTALGFMLLNAADAPPFHDLGTYVATGVLTGTLGLLVWIPAVLQSSLRVRHPSGHGTSVIPGAEFVSRLDALIRHRWVIVVLTVLGGVGVLGGTKLKLDDNFVKYFDERFEIRRASDFAAEHLGGPNYLDIQVFSDDQGDVYAPEYQQEVARFSAWLREQDLVANVVSVADIVGEVHQAFGDEEDVESLTSDQIAQYLLTFELSLGAGQDLSDYIDIDGKTTRVNALLRGGSSNEIISLEESIYGWFERGSGTGYQVLVTGINVPTAHMSLVNIAGMLTGLIGSVCLIIAIIGIYFRSVALALVGLVAVVLPIAMGFGFWGWMTGTIGMAAAAVAAVTLGVVIDDAVHLLFRYRRARRHARLSPRMAMVETRNAVGPAITISSIALVTGFSLLAFSGFAVNSTLGLCTGLILSCAFFIDLYLLPPLVVRLDDRLQILR